MFFDDLIPVDFVDGRVEEVAEEELLEDEGFKRDFAVVGFEVLGAEKLALIGALDLADGESWFLSLGRVGTHGGGHFGQESRVNVVVGVEKNDVVPFGVLEAKIAGGTGALISLSENAEGFVSVFRLGGAEKFEAVVG